MITNEEIKNLSRAEEKLRTPFTSTKTILSMSPDYSAENKLMECREVQIPCDLRTITSIKDVDMGVFEEINTLYAVFENNVYLYNYLSGFRNFLPFSERCLCVWSMLPNFSVFKRGVQSVILVVSVSKLCFFRVKEDEDDFFEVKIEHSFTDEIKDVRKVKDRIFAVTECEVMEIKYGVKGCTQHFPDTSIFEYFRPILFFRKKRLSVIDFDACEEMVAVLTTEEIRLYSTHPFKRIGQVSSCREYVKIAVIETGMNLLICCVCRNGERDYYEEHRLLFSRESHLRGDGQRYAIDMTSFVIQGRDKNVLCTLNENQQYNFDRHKEADNFEILGKGRLFCGRRVILVDDTLTILRPVERGRTSRL